MDRTAKSAAPGFRMNEAERVIDALADFVERLRNAGYNIGLRQHIDAQNLLVHGRFSSDAEKLKLLLAPLLCTSSLEQAEFAGYFDPWARELLRPSISSVPRPARAITRETLAPPSPQSNFLHKIRTDLFRLRKPLFLVLAAAALLLLAPLLRNIAPALQTPLSVLAVALLLYFPVRFLWNIRKVFLARRGATGRHQPEEIRIAGADEKTLFHSVSLHYSAQRLRRHIAGPSAHLDFRVTLEKTVRAGGWFIPAYQTVKHMPEYLALIDRAGFRDHQARLAAALLTQLKETEGVMLNRYFFDRDPRYCYPENTPLQGYTLPELLERHPGCRLLLFSDGAGLFDSFSGEPAAWLDLLNAWGRPVLFSLAAPGQWRVREQALKARNFLLFSADEPGMAAFAAFLEKPLSRPGRGSADLSAMPALLARLPRRWLSSSAPADNILDDLIDILQKYLGRETGFPWLAACAVYPELRWPLALGRRLLGTDSLKTHLARLAPLPWFRHAKMPDWFRMALLDKLGKAREAIIRAELQDLFEEKTEPGKGFDLKIVPETPERILWNRPARIISFSVLCTNALP
ncbi:MAG: hypothetical protein GY862_12815 [Gammaproteobacteria bacterium]|nr:hypothetical protein [Gammaproteobacteria bacterium]